MNNLSNEFIGLIILIIGIIIGWLFNDLYKSVKKRWAVNSVEKRWNKFFSELELRTKRKKSIDAEYIDGKFKFAK